MKKNPPDVDAQELKEKLLLMAKAIGKRKRIGIAKAFELFVQVTTKKL